MKIDIKKALFINKDKGLEVICDKNNNNDLLDNVAKHLKNDYKFIILTNLNYNDNEFLELSSKMRQLCSIFESLLIISQRADIAELAKADGILFDNSSIPKDKVLKILPDEMLTGYRNSKEDGFDFYITETKINSENKIIYSKTKEENHFKLYGKG